MNAHRLLALCLVTSLLSAGCPPREREMEVVVEHPFGEAIITADLTLASPDTREVLFERNLLRWQRRPSGALFVVGVPGDIANDVVWASIEVRSGVERARYGALASLKAGQRPRVVLRAMLPEPEPTEASEPEPDPAPDVLIAPGLFPPLPTGPHEDAGPCPSTGLDSGVDCGALVDLSTTPESPAYLSDILVRWRAPADVDSCVLSWVAADPWQQEAVPHEGSRRLQATSSNVAIAARCDRDGQHSEKVHQLYVAPGQFDLQPTPPEVLPGGELKIILWGEGIGPCSLHLEDDAGVLLHDTSINLAPLGEIVSGNIWGIALGDSPPLDAGTPDAGLGLTVRAHVARVDVGDQPIAVTATCEDVGGPMSQSLTVPIAAP